MKILQGLLFIILFAGCNEEAALSKAKYFSLPDFFKKESASLRNNKSSLIKKVNYDGKEEMMQIESPVWEDELRPFLDCDINKPAYVGAYTVDTAVTDGAYVVYYKAKEPKMPIRLVSLKFINDMLVSVYAETGKSNAWFQLRQEMTYTPHEGYRIKGEQKMALGKETTFTIAGSILPATTTATR